MDRELNRGLIRPPQVTYKELWMLREKESNAKILGKTNRCERKFNFCGGTFGVRRRKYVMWSEKASRAGCGSRWVFGEFDANTADHLQLYFLCGVFVAGAGCVPGLVLVVCDGAA
jgi:hypothetical protein